VYFLDVTLLVWYKVIFVVCFSDLSFVYKFFIFYLFKVYFCNTLENTSNYYNTNSTDFYTDLEFFKILQYKIQNYILKPSRPLDTCMIIYSCTVIAVQTQQEKQG